MKNLLNSMLENTMEGTLKHEVVEIILSEIEGIEDDEIFELVEDMKQEGVINMNNFELSKNNLAWFAFETIAQEIYQEIEEAAEF